MPCEYLTFERLVYRESVWGTYVEIIAASAILDADIYVANNFYRTQESLTRVTRWSLLRAQDNSTKYEFSDKRWKFHWYYSG